MLIRRVPHRRKPGPPYKGPFPDLPEGHGRYLYAIELSNGAMKVGTTVRPRTRFDQHTKAFAALGLRMLRYVVSPDFGSQYCGGEKRLLERMGSIGCRIAPKYEIFLGVRFGVAANLVKQIAGREVIEHIPLRMAA